ncbi:MAG: virulence-associated E family protein [Lachnospiraceae bacterium]|nr:virulence-associated E family protein [Lachnospiraceae bacterium]
MEIIKQELLPEECVKEQLEYTEKGLVRQTISNCIIAIREDPMLKDAVRFNELSERVDIVKDVGWPRDTVTLTDMDRYNIMLRMEQAYGLVSDKKIDMAINIVANGNRYHPIRDILCSLKWDGTERVKHALHHFLGAEENEMSKEALKLFMLGAVSRVFNPGCKFEIMLCLVGKQQGVGKSTFLRYLAINDDWFTDDIKHLDDEKIYQKFQGHWIIELPEMLAAINAKNVEEIKSFLSRQKDSYRLPYDRFSKDRPRQCVFGGTSNKKQFLPMDKSGNRRLIPVEVNIDNAEVHILDEEQKSREYILQMWAEIMEIYRSRQFKLVLPKHLEKQLSEYQIEFTPEDLDETAIINFLNETNEEYVCTMMIFYEALGHSAYERPPKWQSTAVNEVIGKIGGWESVSSHRFEKYGIQRAWRNVNKKQFGNDGFIKLTDQMEIPFLT